MWQMVTSLFRLSSTFAQYHLYLLMWVLVFLVSRVTVELVDVVVPIILIVMVLVLSVVVLVAAAAAVVVVMVVVVKWSQHMVLW
jgi:hypothetical protein